MQYIPGSSNDIADAVSRLHSTAHFLYFCGFLLGLVAFHMSSSGWMG